MAKTVEQRVIMVIADKAGVRVDEVNREQKLIEDLELDELDLTELWIDLEREFDLEISQDQFEKVVTVKDAIDLIHVLIFNTAGWGFGSDPYNPIPMDPIEINYNVPPDIDFGSVGFDDVFGAGEDNSGPEFMIGSSIMFGFGGSDVEQCEDPLKPYYLTCDDWYMFNSVSFMENLTSNDEFLVYQPESFLDSEALSYGMSVAEYISSRIRIFQNSLSTSQKVDMGRAIRSLNMFGSAIGKLSGLYSAYSFVTAISDGNLTTREVLENAGFVVGVVILSATGGAVLPIAGSIMLTSGSIMLGIIAPHVEEWEQSKFKSRQ